MPAALACLGGGPSSPLDALLASVRAAAAGVPSQGLPVTVNLQACQAWTKAMPSTSPDRGEVLILLPVATAQAGAP